MHVRINKMRKQNIKLVVELLVFINIFIVMFSLVRKEFP